MRKLAASLTGQSSLSSFKYGPGLPIGGDYGTILTYFVNRGRPTYGFAGMAASMAVVGVEAFVCAVGVAPVVYLFLDQSMAAESWYYVSRYLYGTGYLGGLPVPSTAGPVSGSPGPLILISSNVMGPPNSGYFFCELPRSAGAMPLWGSGVKGCKSLSELAEVEQMGNPLLVQISLGKAPTQDIWVGLGGLLGK